jgi:hypothetical protein
LAEWSKAPDLGSGPKGRGFKSHSCQCIFFLNIIFAFLLPGVRCPAVFSAPYLLRLWAETRKLLTKRGIYWPIFVWKNTLFFNWTLFFGCTSSSQIFFYSNTLSDFFCPTLLSFNLKLERRDTVLCESLFFTFSVGDKWCVPSRFNSTV